MSVMAWLFSRYSVEFDIMNGQFCPNIGKSMVSEVFVMSETAALT